MKVSKFAKMNGVTQRTVWNWINSGKIKIEHTPTGGVNVLLEHKELPNLVTIYEDLIEKIISDGEVINNDFLVITDYYCDVEQALQCDKNGNLIYENDVIADTDDNRFFVDWSEKKNRLKNMCQNGKDRKEQ